MSNPFTTTVDGSRHPFTVPVEKPTHHTERRVGPPSDTPAAVSLTVSKIRRKQLRTYRSPSASGVFGLRMETIAIPCAVNPASPTTSSATGSSSNVSEDGLYAHLNKKHVYATEPPLPLYHPKGQLALSLPGLDPAIFGLASNAINIDDHDIRLHASSQDYDPRRLSSRARRPAAKLRDVVGDEEDANDVATTANGKKAADTSGQPRSGSPRKRRTAGSGAAGSGKRRRKDAEDADGTYPNPVNRRTRNTRGAAAAVASPLAGPAVVADAEPDEVEGEGDGDDSATVAGEPAETAARTTRSRRSRAAAPKRRGSSASETTTTSVSVSIATNARTTRSSGAKKPSDGDVPMDTDEQNLPPSVEDKAETTPPRSKEVADVLAQDDNDTLEKINHPSSPPVTVTSKESKEADDAKVDQTTTDVTRVEGGRVQENDVLDGKDAKMTLKNIGLSSQPSVPSRKDDDDKIIAGSTVESPTTMDVDSPESSTSPQVDQQESFGPTDSQPPKPKSPSPHVPPPVSATTPPSVPAKPSPVSVATSVPVPSPARSQAATATQPPPAQPQDDEKEEGELSDE
ncbi:hypothetical protein BDY19DRAFT_923160 [Irpex rosettiformis]|uniref:Uncharacterized protein n=1 Tax=Irpex rosettiformis TaxID=378272 RepID=A0ACB8UFV3_9APHY|nr:hypothetical protein BDY19DRAFT_923160 [Irpex rosettiformis]